METIQQIIERISPYYKKKGESESEHTIVYDSDSETLEPIYFFILDLMKDFGLNVEKLIDNFSSAPGSGHFGELGQRASIMQQQGSKILGDINTVLRSVLNILYDLKDFKIRLDHYKNLKLDNKGKQDAATLSLKQIWMDKVDMQKGNSSLKAMALGQAGFVTLIDAFLTAKDEKDVEKLDVNERIKRILRPRIQEFNLWLKESEKELTKRYELEKNYLRSQVNSLKMYSRWAKPYLKSAFSLEQKEQGRNPDLIKTFNTILLELTLLGKQKLKLKESAIEGDLPSEFTNEKFLKNFNRDYYMCILLDFNFRGIPQKISQRGDYSFGGRTEVTFKAYSLNDDELKKLDQELKKSDISDALQLIEGTTEQSLKQIEDEINFYLEDKIEEKEKNKPSQSNPFSALIGRYNEKSEKKITKKEEEIKEVKKDSWLEAEYIRTLASEKAKDTMFSIFDIYKKGHGMASYT